MRGWALTGRNASEHNRCKSVVSQCYYILPTDKQNGSKGMNRAMRSRNVQPLLESNELRNGKCGVEFDFGLWPSDLLWFFRRGCRLLQTASRSYTFILRICAESFIVHEYTCTYTGVYGSSYTYPIYSLQEAWFVQIELTKFRISHMQVTYLNYNYLAILYSVFRCIVLIQ